MVKIVANILYISIYLTVLMSISKMLVFIGSSYSKMLSALKKINIYPGAGSTVTIYIGVALTSVFKALKIYDDIQCV